MSVFDPSVFDAAVFSTTSGELTAQAAGSSSGGSRITASGHGSRKSNGPDMYSRALAHIEELTHE